MEDFDACMHELDECHNTEMVDNIESYINSYKNKFCEGRRIRDNVQICKILKRMLFISFLCNYKDSNRY